jgi:hypothetical protein
MADERNWTERNLPVSSLYHDIRVNPRIPSDDWARRQLDKGYEAGLLGMFVVSERTLEDGSTQYALLDGANRKKLMMLAADEERLVSCQVFTGLTVPEEAAIAQGFNNRRQWTAIRQFQAAVTSGDPAACSIQEIADKYGWAISTTSGDGVIRGTREFYSLFEIAGRRAAKEAKVRKGSERYNAALQSGQADALRALDDAFMVFSSAFPSLPSSYAPAFISAIALVILRDGAGVDLERLTTQVRDVSGGTRSWMNDAKTLKGPLALNILNTVASMAVNYYNKGLPISSKARLDSHWERLG